MCILIAGVGFVVQAVVVGEVVGAHGECAQPRVVGQGKRKRRGLSDSLRCWSMMPLATRARSVAHASQMRGVGVERGGDGAFEGDGAVGVEQLGEAAGEDPEVVAALRGDEEQGLGRRGGMMEAVGGAVLTGESLVALARLDMREVFDLLTAVEGTRMGGKDGAGVEHAHGVQRGRDDEGACNVAVRDGVVV